jgi:hypothetical protein
MLGFIFSRMTIDRNRRLFYHRCPRCQFKKYESKKPRKQRKLRNDAKGLTNPTCMGQTTRIRSQERTKERRARCKSGSPLATAEDQKSSPSSTTDIPWAFTLCNTPALRASVRHSLAFVVLIYETLFPGTSLLVPPCSSPSDNSSFVDDRNGKFYKVRDASIIGISSPDFGRFFLFRDTAI